MTVPQFEKLVKKFLTQDISVEEEKQLLELLQDSSYYSLYEYYVGVWMDGEGRGEASSYSSEAAYQRFELLAQKLQRKQTRVRVMEFARYAAAAIILIALNIVGFQALKIQKPAETIVTVVPHELLVPRGSKCEFVLPDGTHVWINSDSKLTYFSDYNQKDRRIYLEGEAFFEVAKDRDRPFFVHADDLAIRAVGTAFNVFTSNGIVETSLEEGCVELTREGYVGQSLMMTPGEQAIYNKENRQLSVGKADVDVLTSWRDKKWVVRAMPLNEFAQRLERRYDVEIVIANPSLMTAKVSATLTDEDIQKIMQGLAVAFDFKVKQKGASFEIH